MGNLRVFRCQEFDTLVGVQLIARRVNELRVERNSWKQLQVYSEFCPVVGRRPLNRFAFSEADGHKVNILGWHRRKL